MNTAIKILLTFSIAGCAGCATKPNYYRSDRTLPLQANHSIPRLEGEWDFDYRLAGLQFSSKIDDNTITGGFHDMDQAAIAVLKRLIPLSKAANVEYGGYLYEKDNRFYFTNPPVKGSGIIVNVHLAKRLVPEGANVTGDYHTHFSESTVKSHEGANCTTDHDFSHVDIQDIKKCANQYSDYKGYLGTQAKSVQVFAPHSDVKYYIAWNGL